MFVTGMMGRGIILEALFPIALTFRSLDEGWFRATLVPKAELSFRTPRRWRVQGALPKGRKVLECGAPAPLFKAPSRDEQAKTKRKGAARETATKIPLARDSRRGAESAEKKFCQKCRLLQHCTAKEARAGSEFGPMANDHHLVGRKRGSRNSVTKVERLSQI